MSKNYERVMQDVYNLVGQYVDDRRIYVMTETSIQIEYERLRALGYEYIVKNNPLTIYKYLTYKENQDNGLLDLLVGTTKCYVVYLFYGRDDEVLYVGRTDNFTTRWRDHLQSNKPVHQILNVELRMFETKPETMFYEAQKIIEAQPTWNKAGLNGILSKVFMEPITSCLFSCTIPLS